jgi:hypothetical protein
MGADFTPPTMSVIEGPTDGFIGVPPSAAFRVATSDNGQGFSRFLPS